MPKELIHFKAAEAAAERLTGTRFEPCLAEERAGLLLGCVLHDVLFYAVGRGDAPLEALAHRFHSAHGEDPFGLPGLQARHAAVAANRPLAAAVFVGTVAHLFTDAIFHPMVWHYAGDGCAASAGLRSLAQQRHRALEGLMDRMICPEMFTAPAYRIGRLLARCPNLAAEGLPLDALAQMAGLRRPKAEKGFKAAWAMFAKAQRLCAMQPLARLLHGLRPVLPDAARKVEALFHAPQRLRQAPFLAGEIAYLHPVTGEQQRLDMARAVDEAADLAAECCRRLEAAVFDGAKPVPPDGLPSPETGRPCVPAARMTHFARTPFPDLF